MKQRFLVPIVGVLGLACVLVVASSYYSARNASRTVVTGGLLQTASYTAALLDNWLLERKSDLNSLAGDLINRLALSTSFINTPAGLEANRRLNQVSSAYGYYESIHLVTIDGRIVASSDASAVGTGLPIGDDIYRKAAKFGYKLAEAKERDSEGGVVLVQAQSVINDGVVLGLLVARIKFSFLKKQRLLPSSVGNTGRIVFANQDGYIFQHPNDDMNFKLQLSDLIDASKLIGNYKTGDAYSYSDNKETRLAAVAKLKGIGWTVIVDVSDQEIDAPVITAATINIGIVIFAFVGVGIAVSALVGGVTQQINRMSDTFAEVARGDFEISISTNRSDELGLLAKSFEIMRASIKANIAELNDEIAARVKAEGELKIIRDELEQRVSERTELLEVEVAERKQAAKAVRENEERLRQMLDRSPIGIGISMVDSGEILYTNGRTGEMFGYARDEFIGRIPSDTWVELEQRELFISEFKTQGFVAGREVLLRRASGEQFWVQLTWDSINYNEQPCILFWVYDIDELKHIQQQLTAARDEAQIANSAKSDFLAKMSHELRTPLNAIIGISEMLEEDAEGDGQTALIEPLSRIHHAGDHLLTLIDEILDISKIEAGRLDLSISKFKVVMLLDNALSTAKALAQRNNNEIILDVDSKLGYMWSDQTRVRQILFNLLSNASKFTENGLITLAASKIHKNGEEFIRFSVTDSGIGIKDEQVGQLFKEFNQANKAISHKYGGTGLGLAICSKLCNVMGGSIEVISDYGQGSSFIVELPKNNSSLASTGASKA